MAIVYLPPSNDVIPDAGAAKVNVKVSVTASDRHETVLLDLENNLTVIFLPTPMQYSNTVPWDISFLASSLFPRPAPPSSELATRCQSSQSGKSLMNKKL